MNLIYGDTDYTTAINYQHMYNAPITLNINGDKYIISAGTSDKIRLKQDGDTVYIVSSNSNLDYIGMEIINIVNKEHEGSVFIDDETATEIIDQDTDKQIEILLDYL